MAAKRTTVARSAKVTRLGDRQAKEMAGQIAVMSRTLAGIVKTLDTRMKKRLPRALIGLLRGENFGKMIVKVSDDPTRA